MSQPTSLEQLHQECSRRLLGLHPGAADRGPAVTHGLLPGWLTPELFGWMLWFVFGGVLMRVGSTLFGFVWDPQKRDLIRLRSELEKVINELKSSRSTALSPEAEKTLQELISLLQQVLDQVRGKVTPEMLNGAQEQVLVDLAQLKVPELLAEEAAPTVTEVVVQPLLVPPSQGSSSPAPPPGRPDSSP